MRTIQNANKNMEKKKKNSFTKMYNIHISFSFFLYNYINHKENQYTLKRTKNGSQFIFETNKKNLRHLTNQFTEKREKKRRLKLFHIE